MTDYPYVPLEPFKQAVRYDYAQCSDAEYIEAWRRARASFEQRISDAIGCDFGEEKQPEAEDYIPCVEIIRSCPDEAATEKFWELVRKFEVFGRLFNGYTRHGRRHPLASPAYIDVYVSFAQKLFALAKETQIIQFLSTGMKVLDALSGVSSSLLSETMSKQVVGLISFERQLVRDLMRDGQ
tara:strand:+ start:161545 stop:162090 length:546 start_codon:yes stop_codon:yes gene_type:complete